MFYNYYTYIQKVGKDDRWKPRIFIQSFPAWGSRLHARQQKLLRKLQSSHWSIACFNDTYNEYLRRQLYSKTVFHLINSFSSIVFVKHGIKTLSTRFQNRKMLEVGSEISLFFFLCNLWNFDIRLCKWAYRRFFTLWRNRNFRGNRTFQPIQRRNNFRTNNIHFHPSFCCHLSILYWSELTAYSRWMISKCFRYPGTRQSLFCDKMNWMETALGLNTSWLLLKMRFLWSTGTAGYSLH